MENVIEAYLKKIPVAKAYLAGPFGHHCLNWTTPTLYSAFDISFPLQKLRWLVPLSGHNLTWTARTRLYSAFDISSPLQKVSLPRPFERP